MNEQISKLLFRSWPFAFGHVRLMGWIDPPAVASKEVTTRLRRYGLRLTYDPNSYIGRFIYYRGIFEEQVIREIERFLKPGMTFVDVGANIGVHTIVAAKLVGREGSVICFEPQSAVRRMLQQNIAINELLNIVVSDCAVGKLAGSSLLFRVNDRNDGQSTLIPQNSGRSYPSESVSVTTLESAVAALGAGRVDVVKIDVEGAEMDVLEGGRKLLQDARPRAIFVECIEENLKRFGTSSRELIRFLHSLGYVTSGWTGGKWRGIDGSRDVNADVRAVLR